MVIMSLRFLYKRASITRCSALLSSTDHQDITSSQVFSTIQSSSLPSQMPNASKMHFFSIILAVMAGSAFVSAAPGQNQDDALDAQAAACDVYKYSACGVSLLAFIISYMLLNLTDGCDVVQYRPAAVVLATSPEWVNSKSLHIPLSSVFTNPMTLLGPVKAAR